MDCVAGFFSCFAKSEHQGNNILNQKSFLQGVYSTVQKTIDVAVRIKEDPNCFAKVLKIGGYAVLTAEIIFQRTFLGSLSYLMANADNLIDTVQVFADVDYCVNGGIAADWKEKAYNAKNKIVAFAGFFTGDVLGGALWLDELKFLNLAKMAVNIESKFPLFKLISQFGINTILRTAVGAAFLFYGIDAQNRINYANRHIEKISTYLQEKEAKTLEDGSEVLALNALIQRVECYKKHAKWERAWAIVECSFKVFAIAGGTTLFGGLAMAGFGLCAASVGIGAFVYRYKHESALKNLERELPVAI